MGGVFDQPNGVVAVATILLFLLAYLLFLTCAYRCFLGTQYGRYKRHAIENKRRYSWLRFFFCIQLDPSFPKKYGHVSKPKLIVAGMLALVTLIVFASIVLSSV